MLQSCLLFLLITLSSCPCMHEQQLLVIDHVTPSSLPLQSFRLKYEAPKDNFFPVFESIFVLDCPPELLRSVIGNKLMMEGEHWQWHIINTYIWAAESERVSSLYRDNKSLLCWSGWPGGDCSSPQNTLRKHIHTHTDTHTCAAC